MNEFYKKHNFVWRGTTTQGQLLSGEIQAMNKNVAGVYLLEKGINPLFIRKKKLV